MLKPGFFGFALIAAMLMASASEAQVAPGSKPPLPIGKHRFDELSKTPGALEKLGADLPPVGSVSGPAFIHDGVTPRSSEPSNFSPEGFPAISFVNIAGPTGSPALSNPVLLTDGSVLMHVSCSAVWWKLTPGNTGSYDPASGATWTQIASMVNGHAPRFFSSAVLPDGRFIVMGGEYNTTNCSSVWTNKGSIYDPTTDTWSTVNPPAGWAQIGDSQATVLPDGTYLQADCCDSPGTLMAKLNASTLTWTAVGTGKADYFDEEGWSLLPNGKILTVRAYVGSGTCGSGTEVFDPSTNAWSSAGTMPTILADCATANAEGGSRTYEMGPQQMMYNGKLIAFGANTLNTAHTNIYNTATATWAAGPDLPSLCGSSFNQPCTLADAPSVIEPNGKVLFAASQGAFHAPTTYLEYDPTSNTITNTGFQHPQATSFEVNFVLLPTGQILGVYTDYGQVTLWNPGGTPVAAAQPAIGTAPSCVMPNSTYTAAGTQFNGLSEGANYGDDQMSNTNYPLVRFVNNSTGHVSYARTFNHSSRSIAPNATITTSFKVASGIETGASMMFVVANGIASAGQAVTVSTNCAAPPTHAAHDFNNDSNSDIVWRDQAGNIGLWLMNGATISSSAGFNGNPLSYAVVGQRDFDGDQKTDLLWRGPNGETVIWFFNGLSATGVGINQVWPTSWSVAGTGDFDGDGKGDILWRNTNGDIAIWLMNGSTIQAETPISAT